MIAKLSLGALAVALIATAAVAAPLRPNMVLPLQAVPAQDAASGQQDAASGQQDAASEQTTQETTPEPARPRVRRRNSFFGLPLALLAAAGAGAGAIAVATASPE